MRNLWMTQSESHQALGLRGPSFYNTLIFASDNADKKRRWALIREAGSLKKKAKYFRETGNHVESLTCDESRGVVAQVRQVGCKMPSTKLCWTPTETSLL